MYSIEKDTRIMKKYFLLLLMLLSLQSFYTSSIANNETIGSVNGETLYRSDLERLFNSKKKKFHEDLNVNLFSPSVSNPEATLKREEQLKLANKEGFLVSNEEFNAEWGNFLTSKGGLENVEKKLKEKSLLISDAQIKLEENLLLDKYFELITKENLTNSLVEQALVLQEAKARNLRVSDNEITQRLNLIKERRGGEAGFTEFLKENNATIEDAKKEIKNQVLYKLVKDSVINSGSNNFKSFMENKKASASIVIYKDKLFSKDSSEVLAQDSLRNTKYPTVTKTQIDELKELEKKIVAAVEELLVPGKPIAQVPPPPPQSPAQVQENTYSKELSTLNVFKASESSLKNIEFSKGLSEELKELIKKIEERRVASSKRH